MTDRDVSKRLKTRRDWLNKVASKDNGWVKWEVEATGSKDRTDVTLIIGDCSRSISLDFDFSQDKDDWEWSAPLEERLEKIDTLLDSIKELRREMVKKRKRAPKST